MSEYFPISREVRSKFEIVSQQPNQVMIRDIGGGMGFRTVTNDAENVVAELMQAGILNTSQKLAYYDSDGNLDFILFNESGFQGFALN